MFDLKAFRKDNKISQKELAEKLEVAQSFISQVENGKDPMPDSMLFKLSVIYKEVQLAKYQREDPSDVSSVSLNRELGDFSEANIAQVASRLVRSGMSFEDVNALMITLIKGGREKSEIKAPQGPHKSEAIVKLANDLIRKDYGAHIPVKVVTTKARAGFAGAYYSDEYLKDMPTVLIETDKEHKGKYLAFEVDGDSMEPEYLKGDVVICREVKRDLWQYKLHIQEWDFVIAHGTKGIMLKEIVDHNVETGEITCHSINSEEHPDFKLNLREVAYLYNVVEVRRSGRSKRRNR